MKPVGAGLGNTKCAVGRAITPGVVSSYIGSVFKIKYITGAEVCIGSEGGGD